MRLIYKLTFLTLIVALANSAAWAGTVSAGIWYEYYWDAGEYTSPAYNVPTSGCTDTNAYCPINPPSDVTWTDDPPWVYNAGPKGAELYVTDVALAGDNFQVYDNGNLILVTPVVSAANDYICGSTNYDYVDPSVCYGDPNMSWGKTGLTPGTNSLVIIAQNAPFGDGVGDFLITTLPEPPLGLLSGAILMGIACVSLRRSRGSRARPTGESSSARCLPIGC